MSQATYTVLDQDGASFLLTINEILAAIRSGNSGPTEPVVTYPHLVWVDTSSGAVKQRNAGDDGWVTLYILTSGQLAQLSGMVLSGSIDYKRATVAANATTTPLWTSANGNIQDWTGTPTITNLPAASQAGAKREVYPATGTVISHAGNISVQGNANRTAEAGEKWIITAITTSTFYVEVIKKDGSAVAGVFTNVAQTFTAAQRGQVSTLTDGATITPDFSLANNFSLTLGGNRTLANPSNLTAGQSGAIVITQDGTGSRTLAYGSNWKFPSGLAPSLTATASAVDVLAYYVESTGRITARLISDVK